MPIRSKPLVLVVRGDTWNMGHELYLAADIQVGAAIHDSVRMRILTVAPGGGATIRFVREAGWGDAMRYMLTGDHWSPEEAFRMGVAQEIASTRDTALETGVKVSEKIAACGPLGIKTTLASAHLSIDSQAEALAKLPANPEFSTEQRISRKAGGRRRKVVFRFTKESDACDRRGAGVGWLAPCSTPVSPMSDSPLCLMEAARIRAGRLGCSRRHLLGFIRWRRTSWLRSSWLTRRDVVVLVAPLGGSQATAIAPPRRVAQCASCGRRRSRGAGRLLWYLASRGRTD
jgi:hypothetical protein